MLCPVHANAESFHVKCKWWGLCMAKCVCVCHSNRVVGDGGYSITLYSGGKAPQYKHFLCFGAV